PSFAELITSQMSFRLLFSGISWSPYWFRSVASHSWVAPALLNCRVDCIANRRPLLRGNANALVRLVVTFSLLADNDELTASFVVNLNDRRQFREQLVPS